MAHRRRWLRRVTLGLLGFVILVIVGVLMILYVPPLSQLLVETALSRWDASVPARVEWQRIDGSLGAGLTVDRFALYDADERPLVIGERLELELKLRSLLTGTAEVERLGLTGVEVWVDHEWSDLGDPDAPPRPPEPGIGPDLPVEIVAAVAIDRGRVWQRELVLVELRRLELSARGQGREAEAELAATEVELPSQGLRVDELELAAGWDSPVVVVGRLALVAPLGELTGLRGRYDVAAEAGELELDADARIAAIAEQFELPLARLGDRASVHLRAEGGPAALELRLDLGLGERGELHVHAAGVPTGPASQRHVGARIDGRLGSALLIGEELGPLRFTGVARLHGRELEPGFGATLRLDAHERRRDAKLELRAEATATSLDPLRGQAKLELRGAGVELDVTAERDREGLRGRFAVLAAQLRAPAAIAAALTGNEQLAAVRGQLAGGGRCFTAEADELGSLECLLEIRLRDAAGFGVAIASAQLDARVTPLGDPLGLAASLDAEGLALADPELELERLDVDAHGTLAQLDVDVAARGAHERARLSGSLGLGDAITIDLERLGLRSDRGGVPTRVELLAPTRIRVADQAVDIDELSLAAAGGRIHVDGRLGYGPGVVSDLRLDVAALRLARLDPLVPGPELGGIVWLDAMLDGTLAAPNLRLHARARALRVASMYPGAVELVASFGGRRQLVGFEAVEPVLVRLRSEQLDALERVDASLQVWLSAHGPMARRLILAAALPVELGRERWLSPGRPLALRVAAEAFALVELGGLMPDTPSWWRQRDARSAPPGEPKLIPEGLVDLDLTLTGTSEEPRLAATVRARRLAIDRARLGSLRMHLRYDDGLARLELVAKPRFGQLELRGQVPVDVDIARGRLDWSARDDRHLVSLDLRRFDLDQLRRTLDGQLPALDEAELGGLVALGLRGSGSLAEPRLSLALRSDELVHREVALGRVRLLASHAPGDASAELTISGPLVDRLVARVHAPLELSLARGETPLRLDLDGRASAEVEVDDLSIAALTSYLRGPALSGSLDGTVELAGPLAQPELDLRVSVDELGRSGVPLGDLLLGGGFAVGRARVDLDLVRDGAAVLAAAAELPIDAELTPTLSGSTLAWDRHGQHRAFVTGRGIDEALLSALVGQQVESEASAVGIGGRETELAFDLGGRGNLEAFELSGELAGRMEVDEEVALALAVELDADQSRQRVELALTPSRGGSLEGELELEAAVAKLVTGAQTSGDVPFELELDAASFDLRSIAGLLPDNLVDPRGVLSTDVRGAGRLAAPSLRGRLGIAEGSITIIDMRQRLTDIALALDFGDGRIELDELSLVAGRGGIRGEGRAELGDPGELGASLALVVSDFPLIRPGLPAMVVDAGVDLDLRREVGTTRVDVVLRKPEVVVAGTTETTPEPIPRSDDVVFVHERAAEEEQTPEAGGPDPDRLILRVELREPLLITGSSIDMAWDGALELEIDGGAVAVGGQLDAERGRLRLFGNSFDLRRGVVNLPEDGSLDPFLDLEAIATLPEAEVTVTVRGRVSRPTLEFSSTPSLSEYQILTLLVTGSTEIGEGDSDVAAKAASLLAAVSNPQLQNQLQRSLGIDRATIGFGDTIDQPILTVGKRITRDLYVETSYHHNAPEDQNTTQIAVEYGFFPRWSLESFFGDAAVGSIGTYWTRSFPAAAWSSDLHMPDLTIGD